MMRAAFLALIVLVPSACLASPLGTLRLAARLLLNSVGHEARIWVDSSGKYRTEASLISRNLDSVVLRRNDGVIINVPVKRLSLRDQRYVDDAEHAPKSGDFGYSAGVTLAAKARNVAGAMRNFNAASDPPLAERQRGKATVDPLPADIVYIHISDRLLRRQLSRPIVRRTMVNEVIVGTPVSGTAGTTGTLDLRLVPAGDRGVVDLLFHGQVHSRTTGFGGPVQVHSSSVTQFSAVKRLLLDEHGIEVHPTRAAAQTSTSIDGVSTSLPRLRGRIARRIGGQRAADLRPAAESESARKAEMRIAREFDGDVTGELVRANSKLSEALAALPIDSDLFRGRVRFASSGKYLQVAIHRDKGKISPGRPPSPEALGSPEMVVHVRDAVVEHIVRDMDLQRRFEPLVQALLSENSPHLVGLLAAEAQVSLKQSVDGEWWSLVVGEMPSFHALRRHATPATLRLAERPKPAAGNMPRWSAIGGSPAPRDGR
jgi:hypothetical protein